MHPQSWLLRAEIRQLERMQSRMTPGSRGNVPNVYKSDEDKGKIILLVKKRDKKNTIKAIVETDIRFNVNK